MSLLDNNLQTRQTDGYVGNFQDVNSNYYVTNQTYDSDNFYIQTLLQAESKKQNITPSNCGKYI